MTTLSRFIVALAMAITLAGVSGTGVAATGMNPSAVSALQDALNKNGIPVKVDGVLGEQTRSAIRAYQTQHHLPVTGEPDLATLEKLGVAAAGSTPKSMGGMGHMEHKGGSAQASQRRGHGGGQMQGNMMMRCHEMHVQMQAMMKDMQGMMQKMQAMQGQMPAQPKQN